MTQQKGESTTTLKLVLLLSWVSIVQSFSLWYECEAIDYARIKRDSKDAAIEAFKEMIDDLTKMIKERTHDTDESLLTKFLDTVNVFLNYRAVIAAVSFGTTLDWVYAIGIVILSVAFYWAVHSVSCSRIRTMFTWMLSIVIHTIVWNFAVGCNTVRSDTQKYSMLNPFNWGHYFEKGIVETLEEWFVTCAICYVALQSIVVLFSRWYAQSDDRVAKSVAFVLKVAQNASSTAQNAVSMVQAVMYTTGQSTEGVVNDGVIKIAPPAYDQTKTDPAEDDEE